MATPIDTTFRKYDETVGIKEEHFLRVTTPRRQTAKQKTENKKPRNKKKQLRKNLESLPEVLLLNGGLLVKLPEKGEEGAL